jgi:inosine-uridine nucleoside N-ribohydrolase
VTLIVVVLGKTPNPALQSPQSIPLIVDTDVGSDDILALLYLFRKQAAGSVRAITVSNGLARPEKGSVNVLKLLELTGHTKIPVAVGRSAPLQGNNAFPSEWRAHADGFYGVTLDEPRITPVVESASDFLIKQLNASKTRVRLLALGPLTNIAEAISKQPKIVKKIEQLVIMGGAVYVRGNVRDGGVENDVSEWNFFVDPYAARVVFKSGVKITLVGLDASNKVPIDEAFVAEFKRRAVNPDAKLAAQLFQAEDELIRRSQYFAWDPLAAAIAVNKNLATIKRLNIAVLMRRTMEGQTKAMTQGKSNAGVCVDADAAAFRADFLQAFIGR